MDFLLSILGSSWLNGLGLIVGLIFTAFGLWLTVRYRLHNDLRYALRTRKLIDIGQDFSFVSCSLGGESIQRAYGTSVILWNGGNKSLRSFDMRAPVTIAPNLPKGEAGKILAYQIKFADSSDGGFHIKQTDNELILNFDTLGPMEGVILSVVHDFNGSYLAVRGKTHEAKSLRRQTPLRIYKTIDDLLKIWMVGFYFIINFSALMYIASLATPSTEPPEILTYPGVGMVLAMLLLLGPPILLTVITYRPVKTLVDLVMLSNIPQSFYEFNTDVKRPASLRDPKVI
ncbi:MAG TPA: hypothetical protein VNO69_00935 [Methyloceanibacter sp.]|nr:hypothetical protein [Methyloceanibacter sp.]